MTPILVQLTKRHNAFLISKRDNCNKRSGLVLTSEPCNITSVHSFKYSGSAIGKGRQYAKTELEKLNLGELTCREAVVEVAKMADGNQP